MTCDHKPIGWLLKNPLSLRERVGVRGSSTRQRVILISPHPHLLPEGEGKRLFQDTARCRSLFFGIIIAALLAPLTALSAEPRVLVLNNTNEAPYSTDARDGYVDQIAFEAFRRAGVTLELVKLPAERALLNADTGLHDGDLTRIAGLEKQYPHLIRVPEKIMDWEFAAFSKAPATAMDTATIRTQPVGHIKGWKIYEQLTAGAAAVSTTNDAEQLFRMLELQRIDTALYEHWLGLALLRRMELHGIAAQSPLIAKREMFIYLHERHTALAPQLAAALRALKAEGFYERAYRSVLTPYLERNPK